MVRRAPIEGRHAKAAEEAVVQVGQPLPRSRGRPGPGGGAAGRGPGAQTTAPKVEMSARAEARVRRALEAVSLDARSSSASDDAAARAASDPPRPAVAASDLSRQKLARTYDELIAQGFAPGDVRDALAAVVSNAPNADAVSLDASLDWLCFHLPTERLPRRYQGDVRTAADVTSVADITVVNLAEERRCLLYTSPSPRDLSTSRMPSSA